MQITIIFQNANKVMVAAFIIELKKSIGKNNLTKEKAKKIKIHKTR
jgi:hypothetical protein